MARIGSITCTIDWEPAAPDGSECAGCGDFCWLWMWRLVLVIGEPQSRASRVGAVTRRQCDHVLCGRCHDALHPPRRF